MKKLVCLIAMLCVIGISVIFSGCAGNGGFDENYRTPDMSFNGGLDENYRTPDMSFKGMNFECVSGGDTLNRVRNDMVYFKLEKFIIADQEEKGNKIKSIKVSESTADVYNNNQTVAVFNAEIDAESGDIPSGQYYISAYFTYNMENQADVKMYLMNYCFVDEYVVDQNTKNLYNECYEKIKDNLDN